MSFLHNHLEKGACIQIHSFVLPPVVGPACYHRFPIFFRMATHISLIPRSTVIWIGSLEFMSTGFGYNMILLSVRGPEGLASCPHDQRPHGSLTTTLPRPRGGVISIVTAPPLLHDRHPAQDKQQ